MDFVCGSCQKRVLANTSKPNCDCGGLWKLDWRPEPFSLEKIDRSEWSIFRYRRFMAVEGDAWRGITLGEGMTPIVKLGDNILLKMDYMMPTLSFKDRGAAVLAAHCLSLGVDRVVQDSSGNAGNSIAAYCARAGIACEIFVPEGTSPQKIAMIRAHGAAVTVVPGSRDHCADVCREEVRTHGLYYANHVYNPIFYQGTKTYIYEVYEQLGRIPQNILIPVGNGTLFLGAMLALEELISSGVISKMPQIIAVQSERCDPLLKAASSGGNTPAQVSPAPTMAEGIAIGKPMRGREILDYARRYNVRFVAALEEDILPARAYLAKNGIYCEHTTAASYAAYLNYCRIYGDTPDCLIPMCGAGLKSDH